MLSSTTITKTSGYPPSPSFVAHHIVTPQRASNRDSNATNNQSPHSTQNSLPPPPPPLPHMYSNNASSFYSNSQIPGLTANSRLPPMPFGSNPNTNYVSPHPQAQYPMQPIGFPDFSPSTSQSQPNGRNLPATSTLYEPTSTHTGAVRPLDAEESSDAMDLDTREEGELSNEEADAPILNTDNFRTSQRTHKGFNKTFDATSIRSFDNDGWSHTRPQDTGKPAQRTFKDKSGWVEKGAAMPQTRGESYRELRNRGKNPALSANAHNAVSTVDDTTSNASAVPFDNDMPQLSNWDDDGNVETEYTRIKRNAQVLNEKSADQLKVLAQHALLNLAPHNIRFNELVKEGINPMVLKYLYDEVGLKITIEQHEKTQTQKSIMNEVENRPVGLDPQTLSIADNIGTISQSPDQQKLAAISTGSETHAPISQTTLQNQAKQSTNHSAKESSANAHVQAVATGAKKPLERKDLIARMLAAKAAKPPAPPNSNAPIERSSSSSELPLSSARAVVEPATSAGNRPEQGNSDEIRAKEKSRAQTELARQRMEQLKKQGLGKFQSQSTIDPVASTVASSVSSTPSEQAVPLDATQTSNSSALKHPLPDRPPDPAKLAASRIPGLFMTGAESVETAESTPVSQPQDSVVEPLSSTTRQLRKRPRASDFTDDIEEVSTKKQSGLESRPFSPDHRVIIDISEDETMYDSDADDSRDTNDSNTKSTTINNPLSKPLTIRDLPPLSDFPPRATNSQRSTPTTLLQAASKGTKPVDLEQKNMEILAMRQRIAELEKRRDQKRVENPSERLSSPDRSIVSPTEDTSDGHPQIETAAPLENEEAGLNSEHSAQKISDHSIEHTGMEITTTPPTEIVSAQATAAVNSTSPTGPSLPSPSHIKNETIRQKFLRKKEIESGLPTLEAELRRSETKLAQFREEEQKLLAEIAKGREGKRLLIEELEGLGIDTEGLSIEELEHLANKSDQEDEITSKSPAAHTPERNGMTSTLEESSHPGPISLYSQSPSIAHSPQDATESDVGELDKSPTPKEKYDMDQQDEPNVSESGEVQSRESSCSSSAMDESMGSMEDIVDDQRISNAGYHSPTGSTCAATSVIPPPIFMDTSGDLHAAPSSSSPVPEGNDKDVTSVRESSVVSDAYEPPEPGVSADHASETPPFSPAPPEPLEQMDIDSHPSGVGQDEDTLTLQGNDLTKTIVPATSIKGDTNNVVHKSTSRFNPYKSPLEVFRAYRYHPHFTDTIDGGFRSLTYSHDIDPHQALCGFEIAGGVCNDRSCSQQHFRDMSLSDDRILVEMGSLREGKSPEEQEKYVSGLRQIINDMRREKVKDFTTVAMEIAAYRRRFLQDSSRVLAL